MAELPNTDEAEFDNSAAVYAGCEVEQLEGEPDAKHSWLRYEDEEGQRISLFDLPDLLDDRLSLKVLFGGCDDIPTMNKELEHMEEAHVGTVHWSEEAMQDNPDTGFTFEPVDEVSIEEVQG